MLLARAGAVTFYSFFGTNRPLLFAIFPPLMLITFRLSRHGTEAAVMLVAVIGGIATMQGQRPVVLIAADAATQAQAFQVFLAVILLTCLPVAAEVTARARLMVALAAHDQEMTSIATFDPLTKILNRGGFEAAARQLLLGKPSDAASLIAIDFDHFKQINDRWGHHAGDQALKHVASLLRSYTRDQDMIGRLGGDEFMILLPNAGLEAAKAVGERIRAGVHASPISIDDRFVAVISLSIGIAVSHRGERYEDLAQRADRVLYQAKRAGRNTLRWAA
ncbi:GGDEF domain-containing protein [Methylobacterium radiodurans]|uniref:GGDEF domain-containing protein n=1 Tax=Methylobacterium radiodurans TaxID=2202828 RepID=UPI0013A561BE|nr:diguanylate cyclase [Methylobacterium radiodurans]